MDHKELLAATLAENEKLWAERGETLMPNWLKETPEGQRLVAELESLRARLAAAEKELFELQTCMSGRFWMCMKCQRITHSHNCVHQCLCGNWPSSGYFASATFGQWELQNQGAFAAWRADRLATYPPKPASGTEQGQRGGE